jgi:hypothetical protein
MKSKIQEYLQGSTKMTSRSSQVSLGLAIVFTIGALAFTSCKKKEEQPATTTTTTTTDTEQTTATDNNLAESSAADIESIGSQVSDAGSLATYKTSGISDVSGIEALETASCATVTISGQTITVDFGTSGCVGMDGHVRTGKLIYDFSGSASGATHYRNPGFNMHVTSQNYVVDSYTINIINKSITNTTSNTIPLTPNPGTDLTWAITANISIIKPSSAGTITWLCSRTKELTNTSDTTCYRGQSKPINWLKAVVKLNGTASGVNARGENYTVVATNLVRDFNCSPDPIHIHHHPFISGTISYTPGTRLTRTIDYGNGACDLNATVTIGTHVYTVTLP